MIGTRLPSKSPTPVSALLAGLLCLLLSACASLSPQQQAQLQAYPQDIRLAVPFFPQQRELCGSSSLAMLLTKSGSRVRPKWLDATLYLPEKHGSLRQEMLATARSYGRIEYVLEPGIGTLLQELNAGHAVLVLQNLGLSWYPRWHYAVVTGYQASPSGVWLHTGMSENRLLAMETFVKTWARSGYWAALILAPGDFPASADRLRYLQALMRLQQSMPGQSTVSKAYRLATAHWPEFMPLRLAEANWLQQTGQVMAAEQALLRLLERQPHYAPANNNLALLLLRRGESKRALGFAELAIRHGGQQFHEQYLDTKRQIEAVLQLPPP